MFVTSVARLGLAAVFATVLSAAAAAVELVPGPNGDAVDVGSFQAVLASAPDSIHLIDVRDAKEFAKGHFPTATNLPVGDIEGKLADLPTDKPIVFVCATGARSGEAYDIVKMLREEVEVFFLDAEVTYKADGAPVVKPRAN